MDTLRSLTWAGRPVVVEVLGWDEAFVALAPVDGTADGTGDGAGGGPRFDPEELAAYIRAEVLARTRLHDHIEPGFRQPRDTLRNQRNASFALTTLFRYAYLHLTHPFKG